MARPLQKQDLQQRYLGTNGDIIDLIHDVGSRLVSLDFFQVSRTDVFGSRRLHYLIYARSDNVVISANYSPNTMACKTVDDENIINAHGRLLIMFAGRDTLAQIDEELNEFYLGYLGD